MATTIVYRDDRYAARDYVLGGVLAGILAGLAMAVVAMIHATAVGLGFWHPVRVIAASVFGLEALVGGVAVLLAGLLIHVLASGVFGAVFGMVALRLRTWGMMLAAGLVFGVAIWLVMTYLILPWLNPIMRVRVGLIPLTWFGIHLVFGAVLAATPWLQQRLASRQRTAMPEEEEFPRERAA